MLDGWTGSGFADWLGEGAEAETGATGLRFRTCANACSPASVISGAAFRAGPIAGGQKNSAELKQPTR